MTFLVGERKQTSNGRFYYELNDPDGIGGSNESLNLLPDGERIHYGR